MHFCIVKHIEILICIVLMFVTIPTRGFGVVRESLCECYVSLPKGIHGTGIFAYIWVIFMVNVGNIW